MSKCHCGSEMKSIVIDETFAMRERDIDKFYKALDEFHERKSDQHEYKTLMVCKRCAYAFRPKY